MEAMTETRGLASGPGLAVALEGTAFTGQPGQVTGSRPRGLNRQRPRNRRGFCALGRKEPNLMHCCRPPAIVAVAAFSLLAAGCGGGGLAGGCERRLLHGPQHGRLIERQDTTSGAGERDRRL
jgi:hypothetical protein